MSQVSRTSAKAYYETGDIPTQSQFADFIDSAIWYNDSEFSELTGLAWDGSNRYKTLTANTALTLSSTLNAGVLEVVQDGTGSRTLSVNGTALTINTAAGSRTLIGFIRSNSNYILFVETAPILAGGSGGGGSFPTANRVAFWKEAGMVVSGGVVTSWTEATGNGKDWDTSSPGTEPTDEGANGLGTDGTKYMEIVPSISLSAPFTIYVRMQLDAYGGELLSTYPYAGYAFLFGATEVYSRFTPAGAYATNTSEVTTTSFKTICLKHEGAGVIKMFQNGTLHGTFDVVAIGDPFVITLLFGEPGFTFNGKLRRLALFSVAHSDGDCATNSTSFLSA